MNKHYVFVYGTLRRNEKYHYLLQDAELVAEQAWTNGSLFDTGLGFPAVKKSQTETVYGELYLVSDGHLRSLDQLEGYEEQGRNNLYDRKKQSIYHDGGETEAFIYTVANHNKSMLQTPIPFGDWKVYQFEKQNGNVLYFAYGSCLDHARFKLAGVDHYFQKLAGVAELKGYTLRFTKKLPDGGRADIVEDGGVVEGKVYEIPYECLEYLYRREGVHTLLYRPALIDVKMNGQTIKDVLTFIVVSKDSETVPPDHYLEEIIRGGSGFLSETYISRLQEHVKMLK
ncbi:gamma-glutamylcyclotransferase [Bacillus sp. FJAT-29953]|nr:gamma-glutamylcyclotransferase [Bacillus sp. FJAT-29953]